MLKQRLPVAIPYLSGIVCDPPPSYGLVHIERLLDGLLYLRIVPAEYCCLS